MRSTVLSIHPGLAVSSRLPALAKDGEGLRTAETALLVGAGVAAALASAFLDFSLKMPGHAIIRAVLPMSFGLALAPRRMGGMVMGMSALGSAMVINLGGFAAIGFGAMTSLVLTGPLLDMALWRAKRGGWLYLGFALAGLTSNLIALTIRAIPKFIGIDHTIGRPLALWLPRAAASYVICGVAAGIVSALICFRFAAGGCRGADSGAGT